MVNCAGQWAKALVDQLGVTVPLHSGEHFYVVTEAVEGTHPDLPIMRDPDGWTYFKEEVGGLVVGGFEPEAKPWRSPDDLPHPFEFQLLEEDWEHFSVLMDEAVHRVPALAETGIRKFYNGPESFTPDNQFLLGRAPELDNCFVGAGFNSVGIASAGGAGRALAEWVVDGRAVVRPDRRRRTPVRAVPRATRVPARPGRRDPRPALRDPVAELRAVTARDVRLSPLHSRVAAAGRGLRLQDGLGAGQRLRAVARRATSTTRGASRPGCRGPRPSSAPPARRSRSSTRPRSRSTSSPGRPRSRRCSGSARPTSTSRSGAASTRRCSTSAGPTRPTSPSPGRAGLPSGRLVVGHDGARPRLAAPARRRRGAGRHRRLRGAGRDGAVLAGPARPDLVRRLVGGRLPVRHQPDGHGRGRRRCGPPG